MVTPRILDWALAVLWAAVYWLLFTECVLFAKHCAAAAAAKSLQSCPTLCDPIDGSPPGSPVPGILQARTMEWVAIFSNAWKWKVKGKSLSRVRLLAIPWTAAYSAIKRNAFESVLMRWMNLEPIIQSEVTQKEKEHILMHIYGI